ncbi:MraY family glycosyltransferase [Stenotrophobium rhamnosiphilum]|nr:glycosyltransferase [Stenotrophobium rhamnosiphilum]
MAHQLKFGGDESSGVQKFHDHWVPRLGGIPIFISFFSGLLLLSWGMHDGEQTFANVILCTLPAFGIGLLEDITRRAGVLPRLVMTMVAAGLGWWLLDAGLHRLDIPGVDTLLAMWPLFALVLTLVAAGGVAHAINIIDGYNGLSGFFVIVVLASLAVVASQVGDVLVMQIALISAASVLGFLVWNFPFGRIFMGDAGAYLLGFVIAELAMMLVVRNPEVSPWCPLLLVMYPVWETLFSVFRRALRSLAQIGQPDALHLHQLIYRRLMKRYGSSKDPHHRLMRNSFTSLYLWALAVFCAVPAMLFWNNTPALMGFSFLFAISYVILYRRLIQFRMPRFMVLKPSASKRLHTSKRTRSSSK